MRLLLLVNKSEYAFMRNGVWQMKKIYIAGKITNNPTFKEDFAGVDKELTNNGFLVMNPARLPQGFEFRDYWHICKAMIETCDIVYFLPNWLDSKGSHFELGFCVGTKKPYKMLSREEVKWNA